MRISAVLAACVETDSSLSGALPLFRVTLNGNDEPIAASFDGKTARIENCNDDTKIENLGDNVLVTAPSSMKMRWNIEIAKGQKAQTGILGKDRVYQLAVLDKVLQAAVSNPNIVKVPNVYVQGETGGFEGPAAILGASNLMQSIGGSERKQSTSE